MDAVELASKVASLEKEIARLDSSFDRIEILLFVATAVLVVGLIVEYWDDVHELVRIVIERRGGPPYGIPFPTFWGAVRAVLGGILVTVGVSWELIEEVQAYRVGIKERAANAEIVSLLTDEAASSSKSANDALVDAGNLGVGVSNLHDFVTKKETEADHQFDAVRRFASTEKIRTDSVVGSLKDSQVKLEKARDDSVAASQTARVAVAQAQNILAQANTIQEQTKAMLAPRQIDDNHFATLVTTLKAFPKTPVDLAMTRDMESGDLLVRISDALTAAGWSIQNCVPKGETLDASVRPRLPICELTTRGLQVNISEADRDKLSKAAVALANALIVAGQRPSIEAFPDKMPDGSASPDAVAHGAIHLVVGTKL